MENEDKRMAWFPAPYLEKLDDDDDGDEEEIDGTSERGTCIVSVVPNLKTLHYPHVTHLRT